MDLQPWFEHEDFSSRDGYLAMSSHQRQQVEQYRRNGFLILEDPGFETSTLDEAVANLNGRYNQAATGYSTPGRVQDAWQTIAAVARIATTPTVLETLQCLYQREPVPFQTLNFERGTQQRAHSDTIHFNTLPFGFMCGVWVALEDIDLNNGPLFYYPGSQRLPVFHMDDLGLLPGADEYTKYEDRVEKILSETGIQPQRALLRRGQALIWSSNIFHGGSKVLDPSRTRLSQVTHYYFPGCIYYTPLLSDPSRQQWTLRRVRDIRTHTLVPEYLGEGLVDQRPLKKRRTFWQRVTRQRPP